MGESVPCECGRGSRVVKVSDRGWSCHDFEPSTTKDPSCRAAMHGKSVESSNVFPLVCYLPVLVPLNLSVEKLVGGRFVLVLIRDSDKRSNVLLP
ncbi:hypothetical protein TNCV_5057591 [Trichonephila clavipes]|nr:hypothetical protein TNCV_5057591 [Trichonephila clavipes]